MRRTLLVLTLALLAALLLATPALAGRTYNDKVVGTEISAGTIDGNTRYGATFVGVAKGALPGTLLVSINYTPASPGPGVRNTIAAGSTWQLTTYERLKVVGTLFGQVVPQAIVEGMPSGGIVWNSDGTRAAVFVILAATSGTGIYAGMTGLTGPFKGTLSHETFPPTWWGTLQLSQQ